MLLVSLQNGDGFIKIVGEVGSGKTLLCRLLLNNLEGQFVTAYIPNPDLNPDGLRRALAQELGLSPADDIDQHRLLELINKRLLNIYGMGKRVVFLIDEAQAMPEESIEALRLLTNLETESTKLLQVVLFGQPELDNKLAKPSLRQLKQRITSSHNLSPLQKEDLGAYLCHRLAMAGYTYGSLFTPKACRLLYRSSKGLPRMINILCHKAMMAAYGRGKQLVDHHAVLSAIVDTEGVSSPEYRGFSWLGWGVGFMVTVLLIILLKYRSIL